jgi:cell division protein FtsB
MAVKRHKSLILRFAVFAFIVYIAVMLINLQLQIGKSKAALVNVNTQVALQQSKNAEIQRVLTENDNSYKESIARYKLGYAAPDARIYINAPGN